MADKEYKRLTRSSARGFIGVTRASLWLGNDHLLCVDTTGYSESYKRFYFRDIQAIIVRVTNTRSAWNYVWGIAVLLFLVIGLAADDTVPKVICLCIAGLSALAMIINIVRGPTCTCQIRTAVQTEFLPVPRTRVARKLLERVRPLIASAQGQLTPEEVAARMSEPPLANPEPAAPAPAPTAVTSETLNVATASLSSPNEESAGVRSLREQGEIFPSPAAEEPNAPPSAAS